MIKIVHCVLVTAKIDKENRIVLTEHRVEFANFGLCQYLPAFISRRLPHFRVELCC